MYFSRKNRKYEIWITIVLLAFLLEVTKAHITQNNNTGIKRYRNGCECIHYDCGCCEHIEWDEISLNGTICTNASYLDYDYGISVTVTYNDIAIINETVSARNPPPICIGEDIIENLKAELCIRMYDIGINKTHFHGCFELEARLSKLKILPLHLGCFDTDKHVPSNAALLSLHTSILQTIVYIFIFSKIVTAILVN